MTSRTPLCALLVVAIAVGCAIERETNLPDPGFDLRGSHPRAIGIADDVMRALGGRNAWDETRCIAWTFFGKRRHLWDKWTGDYRLEEDGRTILMNLNSMQGRVFEGESQLADATAVAEALERARSVWINDSYWLIMPYKLKDGGVTLGYQGEGRLPDGRSADVLVLTFQNVGDTPDNKYEVWVSRDRRLVEQWAFFPRVSDPDPKIITPWADWQRYGRILLSGDRGTDRKLTDIAVYATPPASLRVP